MFYSVVSDWTNLPPYFTHIELNIINIIQLKLRSEVYNPIMNYGTGFLLQMKFIVLLSLQEKQLI